MARGQLLPINQNQALFTLLGTTYGGNGFTTFALPDLQGRVPIGAGQGPGLTNRPRGQATGTEVVTLTENQMPSHSHSLPTLGGMTGATGGGVAHSEMQPSLPLNYIIALQGIDPSQSAEGGGSGINPYVGQVALVASSFAPRGWALADGALLTISPETDVLYSQLGTTYGGDGITTFALPDLRGRAAIGFGQGPGLTNRQLGQNVGAESVALSAAELAPHSHSLPMVGGTTGLAGTGAVHSNMQPSLGLNYIIALDGIFPSPSGAGAGSGGGGQPYFGEIILFAGSSAPSGWAFADGSVLPIIDHETLFNLIGTTYGGDGETTFALPDLRGRVAVGFGQGPELSPYEIGQQAGVESVALTVAQIPAHAHTFTPHIPGDYNLNGTVDTADYVVWRKTDGTPESYNIWRTHFGESIGGGAAASGSDSVAVPEPHSLSLWVLALVGLLAVPPASRAAKIRC